VGGGDGPLEDNDRILTCSGGLCCGRGPLQKLHWCHGCGYGPFCEMGVGVSFVHCENVGSAFCINCLRHSFTGLAKECWPVPESFTFPAETIRWDGWRKWLCGQVFIDGSMSWKLKPFRDLTGF
jgi:hypothetical protein